VTADDYDPIVAQGVLQPAPAGLFNRRTGPPLLPSRRVGYDVVVVGPDGSVTDRRSASGAARPLAGGLWVRVDLRDHELAYAFRHPSTDGGAGYDITVRVRARVTDPVEIVRSTVRGVRTRIEPDLRSYLDAALAAGHDPPPTDVDPLVRLNRGRLDVAERIRADLPTGVSFDVSGCLRVTVVAVSVALDEQTQRFHDDLVTRTRRQHLSLIDLRHEQLRLEAGPQAGYADAPRGLRTRGAAAVERGDVPPEVVIGDADVQVQSVEDLPDARAAGHNGNGRHEGIPVRGPSHGGRD
jgi:hypothetical protein